MRKWFPPGESPAEKMAALEKRVALLEALVHSIHPTVDPSGVRPPPPSG